MRYHVYSASLSGATGVALGAFGAHGLRESLEANSMLSTWNTAVLYHIVHAVALLAGSFVANQNSDHARWVGRACGCWLAGIALFSGSLYLLALGGPRWLGPITPLGGIFLIAGWLCVFGAGRKMPKNCGK